MTKKENTVSVGARLGDVKIAADEGYQERIENIIDKLGKYLAPFSKVGLTALLVLKPRRCKPVDVSNLEMSAEQLLGRVLLGVATEEVSVSLPSGPASPRAVKLFQSAGA